jgi:hypothetical protein
MLGGIDRHGCRHGLEQVFVRQRVTVGNAVDPFHPEFFTEPVRDLHLGRGAENADGVHRLGEGQSGEARTVCRMRTPPLSRFTKKEGDRETTAQ